MGPFNNALLLHGLIQSSPSLVSVTQYPDWGLVLMLTFSCDQTDLLDWQTAGWVMTDDECGENWEIQYIYLSLSSVKIESFCSISTLFWMWETDQCASLQGSDLLYIYWGPSCWPQVCTPCHCRSSHIPSLSHQSLHWTSHLPLTPTVFLMEITVTVSMFFLPAASPVILISSLRADTITDPSCLL